ncbi:MAG: glycosyltransferase [Mucilaginibacter polytrichastri]|nr:glycosyltransferase [Mucilaginibacter polytrichastri]
MKIAYIIDWDLHDNSGVLNKIFDKIRRWQKSQHVVQLYVVSYRSKNGIIPEDLQDITFIFERPELGFLKFSVFKTYFGRNIGFKGVFSHLIAWRPDVVYYRQSFIWYPSVYKIIQNFPTILEANTHDIAEVRLRAKFITRTIYLLQRNFFLRKIRGVIGVSHEITNLYEHIIPRRITVSNGIDTSKFSYLNIKKGKTDIVFVGTPNQAWHGVEKIEAIAQRLPDVYFHIVGPVPERDTFAGLTNVFFHGYLENVKLSQLYNAMDIGIGSLSLYKVNLNEASPLKVREYLANGLPVILGYTDTDVDNLPYVLNIGNYENNVNDHLDEIAEFIKTWSGKKVKREELFDLIDVSKKEQRRLDFLESFM